MKNERKKKYENGFVKLRLHVVKIALVVQGRKKKKKKRKEKKKIAEK